jgi:hypothetical protein
MRHLSRIICNGTEYAITTDSGGFYLHQTEASAKFAGPCIDLDPEALDSLIAGLTEARRIHAEQEARIAALVGVGG